MPKAETPVCFVISPIGRTGTETYAQFKDVLEYVIKPAVMTRGYEMTVIRADDIEHPGSFIKDIVERLSDSFLVIADLTGQNPNVFYELGVRHALSPRTILIAQKIEDIPSDLRDYRVIIYDTSAKGAATFKEKLGRILREIHEDPLRADNPVLDRLPSILEGRLRSLERENLALRLRLDSKNSEGARGQPTSVEPLERLQKRMHRIKTLLGWSLNSSGRVSVPVDDDLDLFQDRYVPAQQGDFQLYDTPPSALDGPGGRGTLYCVVSLEPDWDEYLADVRVLIHSCRSLRPKIVRFIVCIPIISDGERDRVNAMFSKILDYSPEGSREYFHLEIWDDSTLTQHERKLGLRFS